MKLDGELDGEVEVDVDGGGSHRLEYEMVGLLGIPSTSGLVVVVHSVLLSLRETKRRPRGVHAVHAHLTVDSVDSFDSDGETATW